MHSTSFLCFILFPPVAMTKQPYKSNVSGGKGDCSDSQFKDMVHLDREGQTMAALGSWSPPIQSESRKQSPPRDHSLGDGAAHPQDGPSFFSYPNQDTSSQVNLETCLFGDFRPAKLTTHTNTVALKNINFLLTQRVIFISNKKMPRQGRSPKISIFKGDEANKSIQKAVTLAPCKGVLGRDLISSFS